MQDKMDILQILEDNNRKILEEIADEIDREVKCPCEWMYALVKEWQDEDFKAEDEVFIERVKEIVKNAG